MTCSLLGATNTNDDAGSIPAVTYSDIEGSHVGEGNIDEDPLFVDPGNGNFHLEAGSPCMDAGTNEAPDLPEYDFEGDPRIFDGNHDGNSIVDMGVDDRYGAPPNPIFVDLEATGEHDGSSWEDALTNLQGAVNWAGESGEVWVAAGIYTPTWKFDGGDSRSATFQMANGVAIYGGFDPSAGDDQWAERDWVANETILSGDIGTPDNASDNSYHVFYHPEGTNLGGTAILDGFIITGGYADGETWPHNEGAGMFNEGSSPTLTHLTFSGNSADHGGGLYNIYNASPTLTGCTFQGNSADVSGGGMLNTNSSSPTLTDCTFEGNSAQYGGGMFNNVYSSPELTNCTFVANSATLYGGGIYNWQSGPTVTNCTFYDNWASDSGAGIYNNQNPSSVVTNCILWGGRIPKIVNNGSTPVVTYSDIMGGYADPGGTNIDADPLFADPDNGDFHLGPGSPCIDAGSNAAVSSLLYDFEGDPRIIDGDSDGELIVDMGVDEARVRVYLPLVLRAY